MVSTEARPEGQSFFHGSPASALLAEELMDAPAPTSLSQGAAQQSTRMPTGLITVITLGVPVVLTGNVKQGDVHVP